MSDPWIKVYPADMRSDPAILSMNPARRYALIQAWDLAKNGPGMIDELRSNDGSTMTERELRQLATVSQHETRQLFNDWATRGLCTYEDGLVKFPNLAKRQGIDATAAERKRRERERRRHGNVTQESRLLSRQKSRPMSRDVTGENQSLDREEPPPTPSRDIRPVWDAFTRHHEQAKLTPQRRDLIKRRLGQYDAATLIAAVDGNHRDPFCNGENQNGKTYHSLELILRDADHIEKYAALAQTNGTGPRKLTPEDFDRIEEERERVVAEQRAAAAAANTEREDVPF